MEVILEQMLAAREARSMRQFTLNRTYGLPIISFSMNIPGPIKDSPLIRRGFLAGCAMLDHRLPRRAVKLREVHPAVTGWEATYVLDMDAGKVKEITTAIDDGLPQGRLFDMDVLGTDLMKLDRELVGGKSRDCIVCGAPGRGCASRRIHSVPELQKAANDILTRHFAQTDAQQIGIWAVQSLLDEVCTTPKPGLVDRRNNGSHKDMDLFTFFASASALAPYFLRCAQIGQETANDTPEATFQRLRMAGLSAEQDMYAATGGVNTHKGAIFTIGLLCGAAGRLWRPEGGWEAGALLEEVAAMTAQVVYKDFGSGSADTAGQRLYAQNGIRGIRGEAAQGLPSVGRLGLPIYRELKDQGLTCERAGAITLLHLIGRVEDTNMLSRGGLDGAKEGKNRVLALLAANARPSEEQIEALDDWFIQRNLSPGGCADMLAAIYFVDRLSAGRPSLWEGGAQPPRGNFMNLDQSARTTSRPSAKPET